MDFDWAREFPGAITVSDEDLVILWMNDRACRTWEKHGGRNLVGKSLLDCHPEPARTRLRELARAHASNAYTIEKAGLRKLIYQAPWYRAGAFAGMVEFSLEIPAAMPHYVRKP